MSSQLSQLHRLIASNYNLDELRTLCFDLGVEFENLGGVETRDGKARELILLLGREHRIEQLLKAVQNTRPVLLETTGLTPELINPETYYLELADFETASSSPKTRRKHLTILLLVFGVVIILILSFIIAQPFMEDDDSIELVDVLVLVDKGLPVIEFKVRNIGDEVAFLKAAEFEILESRDISECTSYLAWPVSYVYDVELPIEVPLNSFVQRVNISQAVPANDVDRFQFKIGNKIAGMPGGSIIYQLKIRILYNKNSEIVSDEVLIMVPHTIGTLVRSGASGECLERTYENGIYMLNLQGDRSQELHDFRYDLEALRKELDIVRPTETPRPTRLSIGSQVPHFDLTTFDGQVYSLSDYRGDIVVINFWASWSIPSIEEAPELEKIWQAYQEEGVLVLGINQADVETYALRFLEENGVTYPTGPDTGADIATSLGSAGVPETYVLDREGKVAHIIIGPSTYDELSETIESILRE